ncbi:MAG TPA: TlpA disulfide reductase family protein [Pyrinomonadaceae bacterium]|nr:TlpA disulfide reductase family protein [Pyrinomonadaceae bacterium]
MKMLFALTVLLIGFSFANAQHEYAPLQEKEVKYKNWNYKSVRDDKNIDLREFAKGKKLVMVVYLTAWCPNWRLEAPVAQRLYDKYKANGFDVIGVGEYASVADTRASLDNLKITFPVVSESDSKEARQKTAHYEYRKATGDTRGWGTPWNIFLEPAALEKKGDILLKKAFVAGGELVEAEAEKFIRQKLGLSAEETKTTAAKEKTIEACEPEKKATAFVKP